MEKKRNMGYFLVFVISVAFISVVGYSVKEYTGNVVYKGCIDSDGGLNYTEPGVVTLTDVNGKVIVKEDYCRDTNKLREWYCDIKQPKSMIKKCDNYCRWGECRDCRPDKCEYGNECLNEGSRRRNSYCLNEEMVDQFEVGEWCSEDYECMSNDCSHDRCS